MKKETFYISTPLYYPSGKWHLGHSYTTVCCDAISRFWRMSDVDVFYLTGTDEHGQKIEARAQAENQTPKQYVDGLVAEIQELWRALNINYDKFIRTTDDYHVESVQRIFKTLFEKGDIYKGTYKGHYCTPCEAFWTPTQLKDGKCPDCGRETTTAEEECYFFRLSKYADRIERLLKTDFLQPPYRATEMINNFLRAGLSDLAVTRTSVSWGIPVDFDPKHVIYVWIDALSNYINALGFNQADDELMRYWPCDVHMVGKEIVRFHAIIWPALLMALDLPLPKKVYGHGWLLLGGDKMSKSKGNTASPFKLIEKYGADAVRYYLLREIPFGSDGVYSDEAFLTRYNCDLVNDLGNLVKRTTAMANKYFEGKVAAQEPTAADKELIGLIDSLSQSVAAHIKSLSCSAALEEILAVVSRANKYIDENAPWILHKQGNLSRLECVIYNLLEAIRVCATLLLPFITDGPVKIFSSLGAPVPKDFKAARYGSKKEYRTGTDETIYQRADIKKELEMNQDNAEKQTPAMEEYVTIEDFGKLQLKIVEIVAAERVEKSNKLLKLRVRAADSERVVVSGIAKHYSPQEIIGKKVLLLANLKPVKLMGIESHGMILCASSGDDVVFVSPEKDMESGSEVG